ncbi:hypothetical protein BDV95DRAFT_592640 [Massariosphaeria phaeospora]|uniref:Inner centromere protein ARK-binding domain-containing protein n=1 Tax=Massariosphaeria phaeospora TaxID=100035 RepID=A0A7C8IDV9_9PLEO|nr:hypothetical protein BDV95DRAFT_592640 [Massariosphaeria phaeospora]
MAAARSKGPAIGSAQWLLDERHQSNDLVAQELEDFGFSVRNELEWLNEHMADIFTQSGQNNLDVFKTPGKLRGKTPRTARKKNMAESRQPLGDIFAGNSQHRPSPAQQSLRGNLHKTLAKARFEIAEDVDHVAPAPSPAVTSPIPQPLFSKALGKGKENLESTYHADMDIVEDDIMEHRPDARRSTHDAPWSPVRSTQDTGMDTQDNTEIFSQVQTQTTQATQSFGRSINQSDDERRDTGESFVSAKEEIASKSVSKENLYLRYEDEAMDVDDDRPDATVSDGQNTVIRHEINSMHDDETAIHHDIANFPQPPRVFSEQYSISAETHDALDTADYRALAPEPKNPIVAPEYFDVPTEPQPVTDEASHEDDTVVHHHIEDQMDLDEDVRSPSNGSSPVKPLVRKSSLTFASLPAREPLPAKKSMGNRVSRISHVDQNKSRGSQLGRYTGGKSLGGSQIAQATETHHHDLMDLDLERPGLTREESETTKQHHRMNTQRLYDRLNMLTQAKEPPKPTSQNAQPQSLASTQPVQTIQPVQPSSPVPPPQPTYPSLTASQSKAPFEDDDDDWISPIRTAPPPTTAKPVLNKTNDTPPLAAVSVAPKHIAVSNLDLSVVMESTTPAGSPKKNMDGPLNASKSKLFSAFRAAKEKLIGSSATSAQVKMDALAETVMLQTHDSSDDVFTSPKRNEKPGTSIFSHLRSPSKESVKSSKSSKIARMPGSPVKEDARRTRSSSEREKEAKQKQRAEDRFKEMREKEQSKATAHYQKSKVAAAKTPSAMPSNQSLRQVATATKTPTPMLQQSQSRPGITRVDTATSSQDHDSADDMPPPPPPKSLLPTGTGHKLREPKKLGKAPSKETLPKSKPQKIMVNLNGNRFGQAPLPVPKVAPSASRVAPPAPKPAPPAPKAVPAAAARPASAAARPAPPPRTASAASKPAPKAGRPQPPKMVEKPKAPPAQPRPDLGAARPASRMQTVQDANRIIIPPVNPAKPPAKRPFLPENDEPIHRPPKRPSQQAKMNPITPAHSQFGKGKIPFAESAQSAQPPPQQYQNGDDIELPTIMTDSEDEDSENDFEQPSWVNTPNLREMLQSQQLVDPEQIFGPIAPLNMEQVFPDKQRHKRFRERTSSAYWAHDQVTEEEKRREREARQRMVRDGAWTYNPSPRPGPVPGPSH